MKYLPKPVPIVAIAITLLLSGCGTTEQQVADVPPTPKPKVDANDVVVDLKPSTVERDFPSLGFGEKRQKMSVGEMEVGGEKVRIYVPSHGPYSTVSENQRGYDNKSTAISVDANNDEQLTRDERWFSSLPIRVGNAMYDVKEFDPGGTWIHLAQSKSPLAGVVVGKPCPPFSLTTMDGKKVSLNDYKGKAFLLDVWSST